MRVSQLGQRCGDPLSYQLSEVAVDREWNDKIDPMLDWSHGETGLGGVL